MPTPYPLRADVILDLGLLGSDVPAVCLWHTDTDADAFVLDAVYIQSGPRLVNILSMLPGSGQIDILDTIEGMFADSLLTTMQHTSDEAPNDPVI